MSGSAGPGAGEQFLPGHSTVDMYSAATLRQILLATKHSNAVPGERRADWDYYDTFAGFRNVMNSQNNTMKFDYIGSSEQPIVKGTVAAAAVEAAQMGKNKRKRK